LIELLLRLQRVVQHLFEAFHLERLLQRRPVAIGLRQPALADNRIAVTPLRLDMTDEPFMTRLAELFD